tara:strand:+ start:7913 stop:8803 length:891 start_codon:yes stop_codon:yes gene_type:complete
LYKENNIINYDIKYSDACVNLFNDVFNDNDDGSLHAWKFEKNPFGLGKGYLYLDSTTCVSIRLFMSWMYVNSDKMISTIQAVDSATSKKFRGLGLFSRMTKKSVDTLGTNFVNFPNDNSLNSYLKLGWILKYSFKAKYGLTFSPSILKYVTGDIPKIVKINNKDQLMIPSIESKCFSTAWDLDALSWRFLERPFTNYYIFSENDKFIIYAKKHKKHIPIAQIMLSSDSIDDDFYNKFRLRLINQGILFVSYFGVNSKISNILKRKGVPLGKKLNVVTRGDISNYDLRVELADTDFV